MYKTINKRLLIAVFIGMLIAGCMPYERQVVPFKTPQNSPNAVHVGGAVIAAKSFTDADEAKSAFGFDIRSAGILPVQVVFDNKSNHPLMIIAEQTFLIDEESNVWPILSQNMAYDRLSKKTELSRVAPEAAKKGLLFGASVAVRPPWIRRMCRLKLRKICRPELCITVR
jgi:hypothetical protein